LIGHYRWALLQKGAHFFFPAVAGPDLLKLMIFLTYFNDCLKIHCSRHALSTDLIKLPPAMQHITERNERHARQRAIWLAISLHLVLAGFLYFQTSGSGSARKADVASLEKNAPAAKAKPVMMP
jgi:hypothetical protein